MCAVMSSVCQSYVLACHSYVTFMYSYVIRMPLVGTRMSSLCYSYVLACHLYVTRMYSYVIRMSLVFGFTMNLLFALCFNIYFFYKNLIVLHHGDINFLFWHLYQIHIFDNNLNDEEMITSHLVCVATFWW